MNVAETLREFNELIEDKEKDLQLYAAQKNASAKAIHFKNGEINRLKAILVGIEDLIEENIQAMDGMSFANSTLQNRIDHLKKHIFKLEAICIYHGITNLGALINVPVGFFLDEIKKGSEEGHRILPESFYYLIPQNQPYIHPDLERMREIVQQKK